MYRSNRKRVLSIGVCLGCVLFGVMAFAQEQKKKMILTGVQKDPVVTLNEVKGCVVLSGEYVVPEGFELKIKEGVKLVANKKSRIVIQGNLDIQGTKENPVIIRASSSGLGAWDGIKIARSRSVEIAYAHVSGAKVAISGDASNIHIWNSTFYRNEQVAVLRERDGVAQLEDCFITNNKRGIAYHFTRVELVQCTLINNAEYAISGNYYGSVLCDKTIITKNGTGLDDGGYEGKIEGHNCAIYGNRGFDLKNDSTVPGDFTGNWWGKQGTELLKKNGGTKLPKVIGNVVKLSDFLLERPEGCGAQDYPKETLK